LRSGDDAVPDDAVPDDTLPDDESLPDDASPPDRFSAGEAEKEVEDVMQTR